MQLNIDTDRMSLKLVEEDRFIYVHKTKRIIVILPDHIEEYLGLTIYATIQMVKPPARHARDELKNMKHMIVSETFEPEASTPEQAIRLTKLIRDALKKEDQARGQGRKPMYTGSSNINIRGPKSILTEYGKLADAEGRSRNAILVDALELYIANKQV